MARGTSIRMRAAWAALAALLALAGAGRARAQGVHVALMPALQAVTPGAGFDIELDATQAGASFNGFRVTVGYDPTAITFVPGSPLGNQQGCLMTGGCSAACGSTFHDFTAAGDSLVAYDVLLCDQVALAGPGQLYKLHFIASNVVQVTYVTLRRAVFTNAGLFVTPVATTDCQVGIGVPLAVDGPGATQALRVLAVPNPAWGHVALAVAANRDGEQTLEVLDLSGRLVRRIECGWQPAGERVVRWDGTDAAGRPAPAGVYLVRLRSGGQLTRTRIALLR